MNWLAHHLTRAARLESARAEEAAAAQHARLAPARAAIRAAELDALIAAQAAAAAARDRERTRGRTEAWVAGVAAASTITGVPVDEAARALIRQRRIWQAEAERDRRIERIIEARYPTHRLR